MPKAFYIAWVVVRELIYEKIFYLLLTFMLFSMLLSYLLGQLTYAEQTKLTLDFMMGALELSMVLFCVFEGIFLFHKEIASGSISLVLSKPISRMSFLLGKYLGQCFMQTLLIFLMLLLTCAFADGFSKANYGLAIWQAGYLIWWEVMVLTAVTYLFAVNGGAILTAIGALSVFFLGHLGRSMEENLSGNFEFLWGGFKRIIPDFEVFNMKAQASYGIAWAWSEIGWASCYGLICVAFFLFAAILCFDQRDILT